MYRHTVYIRTPFFMSMKYNGFPPGNCLLITETEFSKVSKYGDDAEIIFDIDFISLPIKEKRVITIGKLKELLNNNIAKRHNLSIGKLINVNKNNCQLIN